MPPKQQVDRFIALSERAGAPQVQRRDASDLA
jgi:hypothetical protein